MIADKISDSPQRLAKWIAYCGWCSRRAAERLISAGRVLVNGHMAKHTDMVSHSDTICIDQQVLQSAGARQYWLYHKPVGIDCNVRPTDPASLYHVLARLPQRLFAVGRLDKDSSGLLLLTNDGALSQQLLHPDNYHEKTYLVDTDKVISTDFIHQMATGVSWTLGTTTYRSRPCQVTATAERQFQIILTQGLHRQIRYMCKALGYKVIALHRIALGQITLADLPANQCRELTSPEIFALQNARPQPKPET